jgi:ribosomal protein S18 acetylase RimI-like enzyme
MTIRAFTDADEEAVIALWQRAALTRPWNDPRKDIARKRRVQPELFLVAVAENVVVGTVMAGYDGHRGWVNYLAVEPSLRRRGIGRTLMAAAESALTTLGCPKINLQVRAGNTAAIAFYERLGFGSDEVITLGKRLERDD